MGKNTKKKKQSAGGNSPGDQSALLAAGVEKNQEAESEEEMGMLEHDAVAEAASVVEQVTEEETRGNRRMEGVVLSGAAKHENLDDRPTPSDFGAASTPALPAAMQYSPPPATTNENSSDQSAVRPTSPRPAEVKTNSFLPLLEESEETRGMLKKDVVEAAASAAEEAFPSRSRELSQVGEEDKEGETYGIRRMEGVEEVVCVSVRDLRMIHISASLMCILQNMCVFFKICVYSSKYVLFKILINAFQCSSSKDTNTHDANALTHTHTARC